MSSSQALSVCLLFIFIYLVLHSFYWLRKSHGMICSFFVVFLFSLALFETGCTFILNTEQLEVYALNSSLQFQHLQNIFLRCSCWYICVCLLGSSLPSPVSSWFTVCSLNLLLFPSGCSVLSLCILDNEVLLWFSGPLPLFVCFALVG